MRLPGLVVTLIAFLVHGAVAAETNQSGVEAMPPVVVKTAPRAGDTNVDPSLAEIRVTFSKDMMTKNMWSWVRASKKTFPEISGEVRYLKDNRTCVLPVRLLPGKTYTIWINSADFNSFRDLGQRPAVPYLLVFNTKKKAAAKIDATNNDAAEGAPATQGDPATAETIARLLGAIEAGDRDAFVVDGTAQVKQGMTQEIMKGLKARLGARLENGYQATYLCQLRQRGYQVHLWKSTFADSGDDVVFRLAIKDGKVAGFFLQ